MRRRSVPSNSVVAPCGAYWQAFGLHLERAGFVVLKKPPLGGTSPLQYPEGWPHTPKRRPEF
jgi:hypothetical protein